MIEDTLIYLEGVPGRYGEICSRQRQTVSRRIPRINPNTHDNTTHKQGYAQRAQPAASKAQDVDIPRPYMCVVSTSLLSFFVYYGNLAAKLLLLTPKTRE